MSTPTPVIAAHLGDQTVLKVYELIPEAYRLKFRARKMSEGETHVEFVRNKERLFELVSLCTLDIGL